MNHAAKPKQKPDYHMEQIEDEILLYHLNETRIVYNNQSAAVIWQLCDGSHTVGEIITILSEAYPEAAAGMAADVEEALEQFLAAGCIEMI